MSVLKYFKNIPRSPPHRTTGPKCNFFSSNSQRGPWQKKGSVAPQGRQGPRTGDCESHTLIKPWPPFLFHLSPKIAPKIQKKKEGEEKKSGEALPNSALVIYR